MRLAILAHKNTILLEYKPEDVREKLIEYTDELKDVGKAFDKLSAELKGETKCL